MSSKIERLAAAGFQLNPANDGQKAALDSLTDDEVRVLLSVKERIDAAGADVQGHLSASEPSGGWCW